MRRLLESTLLFSLLFTSNVVAQNNGVSAVVRRQIIEQMIREGEIKRSCVNEAGGYDEVACINYEYYSHNRIPEIVVMEKYGCITPGSLTHIWIYRKTQTGYQLIYGPVAGDVLKQKTMTNGYFDLIAVERAGFDKYGNTKYRFDGIRYRKDYFGKLSVGPRGRNEDQGSMDTSSLDEAMRRFIDSLRNKDTQTFLSLFSRSRPFRMRNPNSRRTPIKSIAYSTLAADVRAKRNLYWTLLDRQEGLYDCFADYAQDGKMWRRVSGNKYLLPDPKLTTNVYVRWRIEGSNWVIDEISYPLE